MKPLLILTTFLLLTMGIQGQEAGPDKTNFNNSAYFYAGTTLAVWSTGAFYERNVLSLKRSTIYARAGMGLYGFLWGDYGYYYVANIGQVLGTGKHHFEYNLGAALFEVPYDTYNQKYPSAYIGYRFQKPNEKFIFRTGFGWPEQLSIGAGFAF